MVTPFGMCISSKLLHPLKALSPISVTLSGIFIFVKFGQYSNAALPIWVTPFGMCISLKLFHSLNASLPIFVTPFGMTTVSFIISDLFIFINTPFSILSGI